MLTARCIAFPAWVTADGPSDDVAISTRARMARNVDGIAFPNRAKEADLKRVSASVLEAVRIAEERMGKLSVVDPSYLSEADRLALVNARMASRQHVDAGRYRPVILNESGTLSVMVNEEDHLRIQCILPGLQPLTALENCGEFEGCLTGKIIYAKADNYGYLTASLANVGTGFRLSVMLHLVGLAFCGEAISALSAAAELKTSVRGLLGEGTKALGYIFQVSNETTTAFTEKEIASRVRVAAEHLISREQEARSNLAAERANEVAEIADEAMHRLMSAGALSGREAMECLSILRLGDAIDVRPGVTPTVFKELLVSMQLGGSTGGGTESMGADVRRAKLVREMLNRRLKQNVAHSSVVHR